MTTAEQGFLAALAADSCDNTARLAFADWLEEHDRFAEASDQRATVAARIAAGEFLRSLHAAFATVTHAVVEIGHALQPAFEEVARVATAIVGTIPTKDLQGKS